MSKEKSTRLTEAEERRKEAFARLQEKMEAEGYVCQDLTISVLTANRMAVILAIPFAVLFGFLFWIYNKRLPLDFEIISLILMLALYFVCIFLHEGIHGLTFGLFAKGHFRSVSFGFIPQYLTPYCTCTDPLSKGAYLTGVLMPTLVLGIFPSVLAVFLDVPLLLYLGILMMIGGGGDMIIALKIQRCRSKAEETMYVDHPCECGAVMFERF